MAETQPDEPTPPYRVPEDTWRRIYRDARRALTDLERAMRDHDPAEVERSADALVMAASTATEVYRSEVRQ